jgi:hypothetical protein
MAKSITFWRKNGEEMAKSIALRRKNGEEMAKSIALWQNHGEVNRALAKNWRRKGEENGEENGEILRFEYMITLGLLSGFVYSYLHKILIYLFSHIDLSFLAHLPFHASSLSVIVIGEMLKSLEFIDEPPLINNLEFITRNWSCLFMRFNIAEF